MSSQAVTLRLPIPVFEVFKSRAKRARRSVEVELQEFVTTATEDQEGLPTGLSEAVAGLEFLADEALWQAARSQVPAEQKDELEGLNYKQQSVGLTPADRQRQEELLNTCDRVMLVRAHAARLLSKRGHEVSNLLETS